RVDVRCLHHGAGISGKAQPRTTRSSRLCTWALAIALSAVTLACSRADEAPAAPAPAPAAGPVSGATPPAATTPAAASALADGMDASSACRAEVLAVLPF